MQVHPILFLVFKAKPIIANCLEWTLLINGQDFAFDDLNTLVKRHTCLFMQLFTLGDFKIQGSGTYVFDIVITHNGHPTYVKHVLGNINFFLFICVLVYRGSQGVGTPRADAIFHHGQLKN